jgi:archaemetzincin
MITLVPIGEVEKSALETLRQPLTKAFGQRTWVGDGIKLPRESWDQRRGQYLATMLLAELPPPGLGDRVLGVVDVDIFAPELNFVFGEADVTGRKVIISLVRLRQEFYGLAIPRCWYPIHHRLVAFKEGQLPGVILLCHLTKIAFGEKD